MKKIITSLSGCALGQAAKVIAIKLDGAKRARIFDLGVIPGTKIKVLHKSSSGDPTAYLIRGAVIALRSEDAKRIIVEIV